MASSQRELKKETSVPEDASVEGAEETVEREGGVYLIPRTSANR